jgi:response regulator of citrate/malate metabolism
MDDYLSKPFQAEQLVAVVTKWIVIRHDLEKQRTATA